MSTAIGGPLHGREVIAPTPRLTQSVVLDGVFYVANYSRLPGGDFVFTHYDYDRADCGERGCETCAGINTRREAVAVEMTRKDRLS